MISFVNSSHVELPPISFVLIFFSFKVSFTASEIRSANLGKFKYRNIMIELNNNAHGFARFLPAISLPVCLHPFYKKIKILLTKKHYILIIKK